MRFAVDPWDPGYGTSLEGAAAESTAVVEHEIERVAREWAPIAPGPTTEPVATVVFVDGVRRIDARAWVGGGPDVAMPGIFASFAAGAVRCDGAARIVVVEVDHALFSPAPSLVDVVTRHATFRACAARDATPAVLSDALNAQMTDAEVRVAGKAREHHGDLVAIDGPLRNRGHVRDAIGIIKTHHVHYLPPECGTVVEQLEPGERTPVFRLSSVWSRYSWYLRLPGPLGGPWAGVVRVEASAELTVPALCILADRVSATLGRFASEPHKDARAPQNLVPIGGLERELRRRLGDARVLYRALRSAAGAPVSR
jgi:hypothetical protein